MHRIRPILGYGGAVLTLTAALLTPFFLYGWFEKVIGSTGLTIHPVYSGGEVSHVIPRGAYSILVNRPVLKTSPLQRHNSFIQLTWTPVAGLPAHVADEVDLDRDGRLDVRVEFDVPKDAERDLEVRATPLSGRVRAMYVKGTSSLFALIARVKDTVVVRIPAVKSNN